MASSIHQWLYDEIQAAALAYEQWSATPQGNQQRKRYMSHYYNRMKTLQEVADKLAEINVEKGLQRYIAGGRDDDGCA